MNRIIVSAFCIALCCAVLFPSPATASPIPILLVDGQSGGPYHNWRLTTAVLKKELERDRTIRGHGRDGSSVWQRLQQLSAKVRRLQSHRMEL